MVTITNDTNNNVKGATQTKWNQMRNFNYGK